MLSQFHRKFPNYDLVLLTITVSSDGYVAACMDVLQITHAAISLVNFVFEIHVKYRVEEAIQLLVL